MSETSDLTPDDRADLRRRHVSSIWVDARCGNCGELWPCPTIRALDALERCERLIAWLRLDKALGCEHPDWQIVAEYLLGDTSGRDVFAVMDEMSREIDAVMARMVERARRLRRNDAHNL